MRMAGKQKWIKQRKLIQEHAALKTRGEQATRLAGDWDRQERVWDDLEAVVSEFIAVMRSAVSRNFDKESLDRLRLAAEVMEKAHKNRRLLRGEPTEIAGSQNYHIHVVKALEELKKDDDPGATSPTA